MTYPYGQQPEQPGGGYPQTPGQGYPQSPPYGQQAYPQNPGYGAPGYPQAPAYGAMPPAPPEYTAGPTGRPGTVTAAAVLAFVQAGITLVPTVIMLGGLFNASSNGAAGDASFGWIVTIAALVGAALLIAGGVQIMGGKSRALIMAGSALEIAISLAWIIFVATLETGGLSAVDFGLGVIIGFAVFFAIMPIISLVLAVGGSTTQYLQSRRGH